MDGLDASLPIADALRAWRARHGLSQAAASARLGVSVRTLQGWEGRHPAVYPTLLRLAMERLDEMAALR